MRVVHFSADAPAVDVAAAGTSADEAIVQDLAYPDASDYLDLPAGSYDLEVRVAGETTVALDLPGVAVEDCMSYSVFAIGSAASPAVGDNALQVVVAVDATASPDMPAPPETDTLPLRSGGAVRPRPAARPARDRRPRLPRRACACSPFDGPRPGLREPRGDRDRDRRDPDAGPASIAGSTAMTCHLIDDLLEMSIVGSFSRIGSTVRRRLFDWSDPPAGALRGRTVLVTGPTSGLGRAMAGRLAGLGARVVLVGRDPERLGTVRDELVAAYGADRATAVVADMASLASVGDAVDRIATNEPRLDVVIDNAGAMFPERTIGRDGIEATLATMVVGPFALIAGLLPLLRRTGRHEVVAVTSGGMYAQPLDLDDLQWARRPWNGTRAYAQAKRAQVALDPRVGPARPADEVAFSAMHPGWADTPGHRGGASRLLAG